jgi:divalent metal cation (Fe/Co/Zn/Cd) transporter
MQAPLAIECCKGRYHTLKQKGRELFYAGRWGECENRVVNTSVTIGRGELARRGRRLEYFTIAWNSIEAIAALVSGILAGSVALIGFGLDSVIEVISGAALLWRLHRDIDRKQREDAERIALRIVGVCFVALAAYITFDSLRSVLSRKAPEHSLSGILVAVAALVVMPLLGRAKRDVARQLSSAAMHSDAKQADFCLYLSVILLGGLLLNVWLGWWWADPLAALVMVPLIAKEGIDALRGKACCC